MGLNILGIATSIKADKLSDLSTTLGIKVSDEFEELTFEDAISNSVEDDEIFFTPTNHGTILTFGEAVFNLKVPFKKLSTDGKALKYMVGETSGYYGFTYYENGKITRTLIKDCDETVQDSGKSLELEFAGSDMSDLIFGIMRQVSGESVWTIEPDVKSYRYKFIKVIQEATETPKTNIPRQENKSKKGKPWWKFW